MQRCSLVALLFCKQKCKQPWLFLPHDSVFGLFDCGHDPDSVCCARNCGYQEDADPSNWCVYRNEVHHTSKERTVILQDVRADPTLPRTKDVRCPSCNHNEAVFFSASTEEGMTLFFNCTSCGHRWRDYV